MATVAATSEAEMAAPQMVGERETTLGSRVFFNYFHDTYHAAHTEMHRQFAGMDDAVI